MMLSSLTVAAGMMIANHLVLKSVREEAVRQALRQQENSLKTFWELLHARGRKFRVRDGSLWAGEYRIDGDNEIPDKVYAVTGSRATVFMGDTRVATNVLLPDGSRALGTRLMGPALECVIRQGLPYRGEALILGIPYYTAYDPVRDTGGEVIGALFVGVKKGEYLAAFERMSLRIRLINGTLAAVFVLCAFLLLDQRRRAEEATRKQLEFMQTLSDTIPSPIFARDGAGRYSGCNQAFLSFTGLSRGELMGKTVHEVWPRELADRYRRMDHELMQSSGMTQLFEYKAQAADGTLRDVAFHRAAIRDRWGGPGGGIVAVMLDITERKAGEEALKNAYRRTADILEFLPDGTFVVDSDHRVIAWNRALEEMTGVRKDEILGAGRGEYAVPFYGERRDMLIDFLDAPAEEIEERYENGRREGKTISGDTRVGGVRGGSERILRATAAPLYDRQGNRVGGIETLRDITELRRAARERQQLEVQMHHSRSMEALLVQLGHDLKTPLTPLFALLPVLAGKVADPQQEKMVEICRQAAHQIQALSEKALDLVRLSSRENRPELVPVGLAQAARSAGEAVAAALAKRGVTCSNEIGEGLLVLGAADQLELLFRNLLSNAARHAAPNGSVAIRAAHTGATVEVSVQDDGDGLAPEHTALIFHEFYKVDAARHDLETQGLGLSICRRIVANHGGRIWARSKGEGEGTTISFTLKPARQLQGNSGETPRREA